MKPAITMLTLIALCLAGCSDKEQIKSLQEQIANNQVLFFASDNSWDSIDDNRLVTGKAQDVCLNEANPLPCPSRAKIYHFPSPGGWTANLSSIPGARWIWGPANIMSAIPAGNSRFSFQRRFFLPKVPTFGVLYIAADDYAFVEINGLKVGSIGSTSDIEDAARAQSVLHFFDLRPFLRVGENEIVVHAQNGPDSFAGTAGPDSWQHNPAGVVFGGWIYYGNPVVLHSDTTNSAGASR